MVHIESEVSGRQMSFSVDHEKQRPAFKNPYHQGKMKLITYTSIFKGFFFDHVMLGDIPMV